MRYMLLIVACLMGLAFMLGPSWCPGSGFEDAPICAGEE